jgi:hypothetical protein
MDIILDNDSDRREHVERGKEHKYLSLRDLCGLSGKRYSAFL